MREVKLIASENEIPKDYHYDTENSWVYEYRNPYTGDVIQVAKEPPLYVKTALIVEELEKLKAEVEKLEYLNIEDGSDGYDKYIEQYEVLKIINKRVTELKGE